MSVVHDVPLDDLEVLLAEPEHGEGEGRGHALVEVDGRLMRAAARGVLGAPALGVCHTQHILYV